MAATVRKSIWDEEGPNKYANDFEEKEQYLSILKWVEHAKKQTGVLSVDDLREINNKIRSMQNNVEETDIKEYLESVCGMDGIGIPIAVCMLSRLRPQDFPPFDRFVLSGLLKLKLINDEEFKILSKKNISTFPKLYVEKIVKQWKKELSSGLEPSRLLKKSYFFSLDVSFPTSKRFRSPHNRPRCSG